MSQYKSHGRENAAAALFIEKKPTETEKLRHAKEKLRTIFDAEFFAPLRGEVEIMAVTMLVTQALFPSPCGENPLSHGLRRASSPERGSLVQGKWQLQKLSLRESWRAAPERVFAGIS